MPRDREQTAGFPLPLSPERRPCRHGEKEELQFPVETSRALFSLKRGGWRGRKHAVCLRKLKSFMSERRSLTAANEIDENVMSSSDLI
jgi:hypothetical protein